MPRRPPTSGYARLSQADEEDEHGYEEEADNRDPYQVPRTISSSTPQYEPIQGRRNGHMQMPSASSGTSTPKPGRSRRRMRRSSSGVDIKAINARLERWADEIASKFKINKVKGKSHDEEHLDIHHTVFQAPDGVRPVTHETFLQDYTNNTDKRMTKLEFDDVVESVRTAIELGVHPKMISQGSSGSYFARNTDGKVVGVFKPKDEEPYASRNPKWTKWIHRNLFPCFFGRACLIPNLSYVSEAAAYVLDQRLMTNLVPYTGVVHMSSKAFYYDYWQRTAFYRKRKPLPEKPGSFQVFLKGYKDANIFLRDHPWPDNTNSGFRLDGAPKRSPRPWNENCRPSGVNSDDEDDDATQSRPLSHAVDGQNPQFEWTDKIRQSFREELEKLVILDYIMRNTDRGLDNWMVKIDRETEQVTITSEPMALNTKVDDDDAARPVPISKPSQQHLDPYRRQETMTPTSRANSPGVGPRASMPTNISLGAIDNSLSWPWKHPDAWRSFPFGWLFLPVSLIGQPFSQKTRDHFLPLLTSTDWWSETQVSLRRIFEQDSDFKERMFARQISVMKGQAWNVVETLKTPDHGPLELTRRTRVCVWDDLVDVPVATPMRTPSAEMRRQREESFGPAGDEEEMDIGTMNGSTSKRKDDLLRFSPPPAELPNPNRFDLSRNGSATDITAMHDAPTSPSTIHGEPFAMGTDARDFVQATAARPHNPRSKTRLSFDDQPRYSTSSRRGAYHRRANSFLYDGDDAEGDLGYAAARVTEKNTRRVIVERLEAVKSRNPVFTWC